jgi:hypothetical protein
MFVFVCMLICMYICSTCVVDDTCGTPQSGALLAQPICACCLSFAEMLARIVQKAHAHVHTHVHSMTLMRCLCVLACIHQLEKENLGEIIAAGLLEIMSQGDIEAEAVHNTPERQVPYCSSPYCSSSSPCTAHHLALLITLHCLATASSSCMN